MPVLLDPKRNTFRCVLEGDRGKDPEPAFIVRALSMSEFDGMLAIMRDAKQADNILDVLKSMVVGWENIELPLVQECEQKFIADELPNILTRPEILELLSLAFDGNRLSETERKKLESPRSCDAANCASPAELAAVNLWMKSYMQRSAVTSVTRLD